MPQSAGHAIRRRDERLSRTRRVSVWVAGGAAAASLGLGTAFAHAVPGHRTAATGAQPTGTGQGHNGTGQAASSGGTAPARHHGHRHTLAPPQQAPAPAATQAPPQTVSGGS
jgi:hypothetical protein